jgi:biotin-dependent carboxylase-like uncharacterized protein
MAERVLEVVDPGAMATVQDHGRPGHAHLGVPRSGALDLPAHDLANRLVGNPADAATVETTLTGATFRAGVTVRVAVTGAPCGIRVDGRPVAWGAAVVVPAGGVLAVGPATHGLRSYVAVAGGVVVPAQLGSRSTDLLSGTGPAPLAAGDLLPLGVPGAAPTPPDTPAAFRPIRELRLRLGPRADWFTPAALAGLPAAAYVVGGASNRVGLRLEGRPLARSRADELASEGMVLGAVQVPPDGQPVVFLNDHPTTGGYPVVGVVLPADLAGCAQLRPGDQVTLRPVG